MVNQKRNNIITNQSGIVHVINNHGMSSKAVYRYINWGNKTNQYKKGYKNVSHWWRRDIGLHQSDNTSKYRCVRNIQL